MNVNQPIPFIDYLGLREWYDSLSNDEKEHAVLIYMGIGTNGEPIHITMSPEQLILSTSTTPHSYLESVVKSAMGTNPDFAKRTIQFAFSFPGVTPIDLHFLYDTLLMIEDEYEIEASREKIDYLISICKKAVDLLPDFKHQWEKEYKDFIKVHRPLDRLITLLEYIGDEEGAEHYRDIQNEYGLVDEVWLEYKRRMEELEVRLIDYIAANPNCLQSGIYSFFNDFSKDEVRKVLSRTKKIKRERKGRSYLLSIVE